MRKETYYKRKRKRAGLAQSDMAKELGIDYKKYNLIENGVVKMPSKLIDKFNEIVNKGDNNHKLDRLNNEQVVNDFWNEISQSSGKYGDYKLKEKLTEFNIGTLKEFGKLVNISSSNLSHYLKGGIKVPYDIKNRVYLFFQDELNIQPPKTKSVTVRKETYKIEKKDSKKGSSKQCRNPELIEFYKTLDLGTFCKEHNMTYQGLAKEIGLHQDSVRRIVHKEIDMPSEKTLRKIKDYMANYMQVEPIVEPECITTVASTNFDDFVLYNCDDVSEVPVEKDPTNSVDVSMKYIAELTENEELIKLYQEKIQALEIRNKVCKEVLEVINELAGE